ncbi:MAG: PVC-type heme-binding CxxCH protein, partial [Verrucomicrobiota bacterium]
MAAFVLIFVRSGLAAAERIEPGQLPAPFELHPALELQLLVQEPNVVDPVALTFDADGRMYVVEMRDYPYGFGSERKPGGTVRLIEDLDGDGAFERATIFAEDLSFPTSIVPWKEGVLVAAPPQILFLKDTNGDGRADVREVIVQGFTLGVTDSNMNGLRWGLDHRVHGVNGGNGGRLTSPEKPEAILSISKADFSFDPDSGDITRTFQTSGGFGLVFDDWGRSFVTYNIDHIQHPVVPLRFLERFPGLPPQETTVSISDHGEMARIYPISVPETRVNHPEQSGHFSAAGGMGWIGAGIFPSELYGSILVCDVVGNLVHRDQLVPSGPIFRARRPAIEQEREFFASRDNAFRPVGLELGPDGALYLIDMQRDVIEHPDYIPKKVLEKLDIRAGEMRGRIYRIAPKGMRPVSFPKLAQAKTAVLLDELSSDNAWRRSTAQRLLLERQEKWAVSALKRIAREGKKPLGRLHALWTLRGLNALDESLLLRALRADEPGLRENALQLAETRLSASKPLQEAVLQLAEDPDVRVRFQAALMLGNIDEITAYRALAIILARDFEHR